ncbi:MAG: hypothetical protein LC798_06960 [Chloroflexi bacterium]|nr:hypothetical protein [Chloroflexota bacterium]
MRIQELRPLVVDIAAPQAMVFEMASATNGSLPGSPPHSAELLGREGDVLLVRNRTPALITELVMLERVRLLPSSRPIVGNIVARLIAVPAYDRFMRRQLHALRDAAEARAVRSRRYRRPDAA